MEDCGGLGQVLSFGTWGHGASGDLLPDRGTLVPCRGENLHMLLRSKHEAAGANGQNPRPTHAQSSRQITSQMPRQITTDAHEWINEIPTVPIYYLAKPQPRERTWENQRGKKTLLSLTLVSYCGEAFLA